MAVTNQDLTGAPFSDKKRNQDHVPPQEHKQQLLKPMTCPCSPRSASARRATKAWEEPIVKASEVHTLQRKSMRSLTLKRLISKAAPLYFVPFLDRKAHLAFNRGRRGCLIRVANQRGPRLSHQA